jgi:hypothetical protein
MILESEVKIKLNLKLGLKAIKHNMSLVSCTVDPVYSYLGYSEYPLIVNGFLRTDR